MKIQHLAVIFIIIILPISIVISTYVNNLIDVSNKQAEYDSILLNSTYDAVRAYQINTVNNDFASVSASRVRDLNASINSFFNSLATGVSSSAYTKTELNSYVPAILFTLYDGYYVYGPHENYVKIGEKTVDGEIKRSPQYIGNSSGEKIETEYGLKPYTYYSCEYQGAGYHLIINYTLDNYIGITGNVNGKFITASGYYINPNKVTNINESARTLTLKTEGADVIIQPEVLGEYAQVYDAEIVNKKTINKKSYHRYYNYINYNETKYYYDDEAGEAIRDNNVSKLQEIAKNNRTFDIDVKVPIFRLNKNLKEYISMDELGNLALTRGCSNDALIDKSQFQDVNSYWYYKNAKEFSEESHEYLKNIQLNANGQNGYKEVKTESFNNTYEVETNDGVKAGNDAEDKDKLKAHEKYNYDKKWIFDYEKEKNDPEIETSFFNQHRMDVIISSVEKSLSDAIADFNAYQSNTYSYRMPAISETDWYKIANNVNIVSFMQGQVVGNYKYYNNYALVTDTKNKEFIAKDAINVQNVIPGTQGNTIDQNTLEQLEIRYRNDNYGENYHNPGCIDYHKQVNDSSRSVVGYRLIDYDIDSFIHDYKNILPNGTVEQKEGTEDGATNNDKEYSEVINSYMQPGTGGYECVVSRNGNDWTYDELLTGKQIEERKDVNGNSVNMETMNEIIRTAYISALAREKGESFKNFSMLGTQTAQERVGLAEKIPAAALESNPTSWTRGNVTVKANNNERWILQTSIGDKNNWTNQDANQVTVDRNTTVYARYWNGYKIGPESSKPVTNIDKEAPDSAAPSASTTETSIAVTCQQQDNPTGNNSGRGKTEYKLMNNDGSTRVDWTTNNTFSGLQKNTTYRIQTRAWDNVGNGPTESAVKAIKTDEEKEVYAFWYDDDGNGVGETLVLASKRNIERRGTLIKSCGKYRNSMGVPLDSIGSIEKVEIFDKIQPKSTSNWFFEMQNLEQIVNIANLDTSKVTSMYAMFYYCKSLTSIDLSGFNTSQVTNMADMFRCCESLTSLDLSNFNTRKVTDMRGMLEACKSLTSLDLSNFNTSQVTDMGYMFHYCFSLTSLDLSNFDTRKVTDMRNMFCFCESLTSIDLSNFDTRKVTDMQRMLSGCKSLTSLDLSNFDTRKVTDMRCMLEACESLTSLDLSNFNTSQVTDMDMMFNHCRSLTSLDLSNFDTRKVTDMSFMFNHCRSLTSLDLSNFDTRNVTEMNGMFCCCYKLKTIYVSKMFNTNKINSYWSMFDSCHDLVGGKGTKLSDINHFDRTTGAYARIDGGPSNPGYFTKK